VLVNALWSLITLVERTSIHPSMSTVPIIARRDTNRFTPPPTAYYSCGKQDTLPLAQKTQWEQ
jgi:hypothetical protein